MIEIGRSKFFIEPYNNEKDNGKDEIEMVLPSKNVAM